MGKRAREIRGMESGEGEMENEEERKKGNEEGGGGGGTWVERNKLYGDRKRREGETERRGYSFLLGLSKMLAIQCRLYESRVS